MFIIDLFKIICLGLTVITALITNSYVVYLINLRSVVVQAAKTEVSADQSPAAGCVLRPCAAPSVEWPPRCPAIFA